MGEYGGGGAWASMGGAGMGEWACVGQGRVDWAHADELSLKPGKLEAQLVWLAGFRLSSSGGSLPSSASSA